MPPWLDPKLPTVWSVIAAIAAFMKWFVPIVREELKLGREAKADREAAKEKAVALREEQSRQDRKEAEAALAKANDKVINLSEKVVALIPILERNTVITQRNTEIQTTGDVGPRPSGESIPKPSVSDPRDPRKKL